MRLVAVHQCDLTTLGGEQLSRLEIHAARPDVGEEKILVALLMGDIAAVKKIVLLVIVIMPDAGHIEKQVARRGGRRGEKTLGARQHAGFIGHFHIRFLLVYMIAQNMNRLQCFIIANQIAFLYAMYRKAKQAMRIISAPPVRGKSQ